MSENLRSILENMTDLTLERLFDNLIDYAIDEVVKGVKIWLQQKLAEMPRGEYGEKTMMLALLDELEEGF